MIVKRIERRQRQLKTKLKKTSVCRDSKMCLKLAYSGGDLCLLLKCVPRQKWSIPMSYVTQSHQSPRWVSILPAYSKYGKSSQQLSF